MNIETISLYKDGTAWCAALGTYPECSNPHVEKAFGASRAEALKNLSILLGD